MKINHTKNKISTSHAWHFAQQGETYRLTKYYDEAIHYFNEALRQNPRHIWALAHRGASYMQSGKYTEALADLNKAIKRDRNYCWAYAQRGETHYFLGPENYEQALQDFNKAISFNDQYAWAYAHRGQVYRFMGEEHYDRALEDFVTATTLNPSYAWAWGFRYTIKSLQQNYEDGLYDFLVATNLNKEIFSDPFHELCQQLIWLGRYDQALAMHMRAHKQNPDDLLNLYNIAILKGLSQDTTAFEGMGESLDSLVQPEDNPELVKEIQMEIKKAELQLEKVINTDQHGVALYGLGGLAAIEGEYDTALGYLERAIADKDDNFFIEWAKHDLAWKNLRTDSRFIALISPPG